MSARVVALGGLLTALVPILGGGPSGVRALAPFDVLVDGLDEPSGIAVDSDERVFVADRSRGTVIRIAPDGTRTVVARRLKHPGGLAVDAEARVLVAEEGGGRVLRLDGPAPQTVASGLDAPRWLAVGHDGTLYVVVRAERAHRRDDDDDDERRDAIVAIRPDGRTAPFADGLREVAGLATDANAVYVAARTPSGRVGVRRYAIPTSAAAWLAGTDVGRRARGFARDRLGAFWLSAAEADVRGARLRDVVVKLSARDGTLFASGLDEPGALAVGFEGHLYVADTGRGRVLRFRAPAPPSLTRPAEAVANTALALRGTAVPSSRIDVFVNDADAPATVAAGADGSFTAVVVLAENAESHLEAFATAAHGEGLSSAPALLSVIHDGEQPDVAFVRPPAGGFVRRSVDVEVQARDTGSGVASLTVVAGTRAVTPALSPPPPAPAVSAVARWDTGSAADGAVTLAARAADRAGNERQLTRIVIVDNTPPDVRILEGPGSDTSDATVVFVVAGSDNLTPAASLTFSWQLDGAGYGPFGSSTSITVGPVTPGPHLFEVKARDLAGNESPLPAAHTFSATSAPTITALLPARAAVGTPVTIVGGGFGPGPVAVSFGGVRAAVRRVSTTSVSTSVPPGATSGAVTVTTPRGTATRAFDVDAAHDLALRARPGSLRTLSGLPVTATITLDASGRETFTGLATLRVQQVPDGVTARLDASALAAGRSTTLTLTPSTTASSGPVVLEATAVVDGSVTTRMATLSLDVAAGDRTALAGRLTLVDDTPIGGARLTLAGTTLLSDEGGNFLFLEPAPGQQMLGVDVNAAVPGLPIYAIDVELVAGRATRLPPLRITPPPAANRFVAIDNALQDQVIVDAAIPGFALTLPAGTTIVGWDGTPKQRIAVGQLTADTLPVPPPAFPARVFYQVFFGTPMGGLPSQPLPVTLPNDQDLEPGETVEIWYYDAAPIPGVVAGWRLAGDATVTADGTRVVSKPGVGLARFCGVCGIACIKRKVSGQPNVDPNGVRGGDPVDLATGLLVLEKTDLALAGRVPALLYRVYNAVDPFGRVAGFELSTGPGWTLSVDVALIDDGSEARLLVMPGNARVLLSRGSDGAFRSGTTPQLAGAVLHAEADGEHRLVFKDGAAWRFRAGWRARVRSTVLPGLGLLVEQVDRHGNRLIIDRDKAGAVSSIAEPAGRTLTFTTALLDPADPTSARLVTVLDPLGRRVHYGYDAQRRLSTVTDAAGGVVRYTYDGAGRIVSITDPRGITYLTNEYDADGRVVRQLQPDGGVWRLDYDGPVHAHTRATVTDPVGAATTHVFAGGRPVATIDALGQPTRRQRDATGRVASVSDAAGRTVTVDYDGLGNVVRLTDPIGQVRTIDYAGDRPLAVAEPLGRAGRLEYDAAGHASAMVNPAGVRTRLEVDATGLLTAVTDASGRTTRLEYARTGDLTAVVDPLGGRTTLEYDAVSRLVGRRDAAGGVVRLTYDALDRIVQIVDGSGVVRQEYDANGNLTSVTDPLGRVVRYTYDVMDRRVAKTDAVGLTERYEYDAAGNLTRVVDRKGQASVYRYDALGRRLGARYADGTLDEFTYDAAGRLVRAATGDGAILFDYDALDRLVAETTALGTTRYGWDALGRRVTMTRPSGRVVGYTYDAASRLATVSAGAQRVTLEYDDVGRRLRARLPNGIDVDYAYDTASRLRQLAYRRNAEPLGTLSYRYDELGRRIEVSGSLAAAALPEAMESAVYDAANRPQRFGDRWLTHDANGNLSTIVDGAGTRMFSWDARDRLAAVSDGVAFAYDALGRRTMREDPERVVAFGYDIADVEEDVTVDAEHAYLRGPTPDELFAAGEMTVLADAAGSVMRMLDSDGVAREAVVYEPFGRAATGAGAGRYGFTGREREASDLYYYRARYYHAGLARFISEDPLGLAAGINPYAYALNDPVNLADPSGLRTYVLHGVWPDRVAAEDLAASLRTADPSARTLDWNGHVFGGVVPSTSQVAPPLLQQILTDLDTTPLEAAERLNLVGFSGGGLVAATLADMLRARGVKVHTVVTMGTIAQTPFTTRVPAQTRLLNFIGVADPLTSFRLHPRGSNYLVLAKHSMRSYTDNPAVLSLIKREIAR